MPFINRPALVLLLGLLLALSACTGLNPRDPLNIDLVGLEPLPAQELEVRFAVKLRVQNPNDRAIDYNGLSLALEVNGQRLASGVSDQRGQVPRFGETLISVPISISAYSAVRQAWRLAGHTPGQGLPYVLRGKLGGGLFGNARFSDTGTLNWPEPEPAARR